MKETVLKQKKIVTYARFSCPKQDKYSIEMQDGCLVERAKIADAVIVRAFYDKGKSAKQFNIGWYEMKAFLQKNKGIEEIWTFKYCRITRNAEIGLKEITDTERKFGVKIVSVMEDFGMNRRSPMFFKWRSEIINNAHYERLIVSERTTNSIHFANKAGYFAAVAPVGYKNVRIGKERRSMLVIDEEKAPAIVNIFKNYMRGMTLSEIAKIAKEEGVSKRGKSAIQYILSNHTYAGFVGVNGLDGEGKTYVKGLHEAIISPSLFNLVQEKLMQANRPKNIIEQPETPLRGILTCAHNHTITSCKCKSKTGAWHWYYTCNRCQKGEKKWVSAKVANQQFVEMMDSISFTENDTAIILQKMRVKLAAQIKHIKEAEIQTEKQKKEVQTLIATLTEKYIKGTIKDAAYKITSEKYETELAALNTPTIDITYDEVLQLFEKAIPNLCNLRYVFDNIDYTSRRMLLQVMFDGKLTITKEGYRTTFLHPFLQHNLLNIKSLHYDKNNNICGENVQKSESDLVGEFIELFRVISSLKVA